METDTGHTGLTLRLLGAFEMLKDGSLLPRTRTRKEQWLLALLVLGHGKPLDRSKLAATLWLDSTESQALDNLRRSLYNLRQVLGEDASSLVSATSRTVSFDLSGATCDVIAFDHAISQGDPASLQEAVDLYRGPLLDGCVEEWALTERLLREQAYLSALEKLAGIAASRDDSEKVVHCLTRLVTADPFRESAQRTLMGALAARGDLAAATLVYRNLRLRLHDDLRTEPAPETTALYQRLRTAARARSAPTPEGAGPRPPLSVPRPVSSLVGRGGEIAEVSSRLATSRLVMLTGSGGVGKTRLSIAVADAVATEFPDGVWFIDLAPLTDGAFVPQTIAARLGVREEPARPVEETLADYLSDRSLLLILDNCEHLLRHCANLAGRLLETCSNVRILATSRQPLGISGESVFSVAPLGLPVDCAQNTASFERILDADAVRLFVERAMEASTAFVPTDRNAAAIARICRQLDGIPLALELAAVRVKVLTPQQIAARLDERFQLLTAGGTTALPRHQTLRACIDWSHDLLRDSERTFLRRLAVFAGGWTLEAAEEICSGSTTDQGAGRDWMATLDLLSCLVDRSLVAVDGADREARYRLLETIREYAGERMAESGEAEGIRLRHLCYYAQLAERSELYLSRPDGMDWMESLEGEHDNFRAALQYASEPVGMSRTANSYLGLRLAAALARFWYMHGRQEEGRRWLNEMLERYPDAPAAARAKALNGAGLLTRSQGDHSAARSMHDASFRLYREAGDATGAAWALTHLGVTLNEQGETDAAVSCLEESLSLMRAAGDREGTATALGFLGLVRIREDRHAEGRALCEEALEIQRALGDRKGIATVLNHLAEVARLQGDYTAAWAHGSEAIALLRPLDDRPGISSALNDLAITAWEQGNFAEARQIHEESLAIQQEMRDQTGIAWTYRGLGMLELVRSEFDAARSFFEESLSICRTVGEKPGIAASLYGLGSVAVKAGHCVQARRHFADCMQIWKQIGDRRGVSDALNGLGLAASWTGDLGSARALFEEALAIKRETLDELGAAVSLFELGRLALSDQDFNGARDCLVENLAIHDKRGNKPGIVDCIDAMAVLIATDEPNDWSGAARLLGASDDLREAIGYARSPHDKAEFEKLVSDLRHAMGDEAFTAAFSSGRAMRHEAVALALRVRPPQLS